MHKALTHLFKFFASWTLSLWVLQQLDPPCFGVVIVGPSLAPLVSSFTAHSINKSFDIQPSCDELFPDFPISMISCKNSIDVRQNI